MLESVFVLVDVELFAMVDWRAGGVGSFMEAAVRVLIVDCDRYVVLCSFGSWSKWGEVMCAVLVCWSSYFAVQVSSSLSEVCSLQPVLLQFAMLLFWSSSSS